MYDYQQRRLPIAPLLIIPVLLFLLVPVQLVRGAPSARVETTIAPALLIGEAPALPLPKEGSVSLAIDGIGTVTVPQAAGSKAVPIASVTKLMAAHVILKDKPLRPGEAGPMLTITPADVTRYLQMIANDESTLPVVAGMQLSQRDMLIGLLVPSANNFSEYLAAWDAGTKEAFVARMNAEARALGMTSTFYADTSGLSSASVSTAADQLILARTALQNPVLAEIVAMPTARLPGIGQVQSTNQLLGADGFVGIKTGFTEDAGGNLAFAAKRQVGGQDVLVTGVILGQTNRPVAFAAARTLVLSLDPLLKFDRLVAAGQPVATIDTEWGAPVDVVVSQDVKMLSWPGTTLETSVQIDRASASLKAGDEVGTLTLRLGEQEMQVPLTVAKDVSKPGLLWKLTRL